MEKKIKCKYMLMDKILGFRVCDKTGNYCKPSKECMRDLEFKK